MTPEDRLFAAIIDNAVDASLLAPPGELPDYDCVVGCKRWVQIRDKRRRMREQEENRIDGKDTVNSEYVALLYNVVHHVNMEPLIVLIRDCWKKIEIDPSLSLYYRKIFNKKSQSMADRREWHEV